LLTKTSSEFLGAYGFDREAMAQLDRARTSTRLLDRHETIVKAGVAGPSLIMIRTGWAGRVCEDADGRRQIIDLLLPGELGGLEALVCGHETYAIKALTAVDVVRFDSAMIASLMSQHSELVTALLRHSVRQTANARANQARMFKRSAAERLADFIHALMSRLDEIGAHPSDPEIPLTQFDLADATGMTAIHVNRALRDLRARGFIAIDRRRLCVRNLAALRALADRTGAEPAGN
jgi:CRP-like cAMP-binding protein